jgi:hypothetical protein
VNKKIQSLLDGGFITIEDILEYAQQYMDAVDKYDDEQLDKYTHNLEDQKTDVQ